MLHVRIYETLYYRVGKGLKLRLREIKSLEKLAIHHLLDELAYFRILDTLLDSIKPREITYRRQDCVRAVEESYLSFMVRCLAWNKEDIQTCLVCRELGSYSLRSLDYPEVENLALYHEIVLESDALVDLVDGVLRIARNDSVYEGAVNTASLLEPCLEVFSEIPEVDVLIYALLELLAVKEDELARKDDESLGHVAVEVLVSVIKKLSKLAGI